jgi:hypothetical protein
VNGKYRNPPKSTPEEADAALAALTEAQHRAAEQRIAAEKLAEDARRLEQSLAAEADKARHAADHAQALRLQQAAEHARIIEGEAAEKSEACTAKLERKAADRAGAEAHSRACRAVQEGAASEVAQAEALLAAARQKLALAKAAIVEAGERESKTISAEDSARIEASESLQLLNDRRAARENLEEELRVIRERVKGFERDVPSLATIDQVDELESRRNNISEAARRIAERRAADAARRALRS